MAVFTHKTAMALLAAITLTFSACQKEHSELSSQRSNEQAAAAKAQSNGGNGMTVTEITFTATAMIAACHGENIRFTGIIENRVKTTVSASGEVHYTRHFTVKGMTGLGLTTGTVYDVVGGAEMFSIKDAVFVNGALSLPLSLQESDIVIHRGTLVFVSRTDGSRVVARHDIQKVPGAGLKHDRWLCGGDGGQG